MNATKQLTRILGLAATVTVLAGLAGVARAGAVPPPPDKAFVGTWVNTSADGHLQQIIIEPAAHGTISVDAFGNCSTAACEWGSVPATSYGTSATSTSGTSFQTIQRFVSDGSETSRTALLGHLTEPKTGPRLSVNELTVAQNVVDSHVIETFEPGPAATPGTRGNSVKTYGFGNQPAEVKGLAGTWKVMGPAGSLTKLKISGSLNGYGVQAAGRCPAGSCYLGRAIPLMYADSNTSRTGRTLLVPFTSTDQKTQLVVTYADHHGREGLTVAEYHEYTDAGARSDYRAIETFARV